MTNQYQMQIDEDLEAFFDVLVNSLENTDKNIPTIIKMLEALRAAECFNEIADFVEEVLEEGQTYKLFHAIIEYLPKNKDLVEELVALVCERDLIAPEDLKTIATWDELIWDYDSDDYNRSKCGMATAACNLQTEPDVLANIATNCSWEIACRIAANPRTQWEALFRLASRAVDNESGFEDYAAASVIVTMFMRADASEANLNKLRSLISDHAVVELLDKYLVNRDDPEVLRNLL